MKRVILFFLLLLIGFVLLGPTVSLKWFIKVLTDASKWNATLLTYAQAYLEPLLIILVNFFLMPILIDMFSTFEDYRRKSSRHNAIMVRNYFFMFVNIFILPIMS